MSTRWARFARGWIAAVLATATAAAGHTFGGAEFPVAAAILVALAFSGMACVFLAGRRLSTWRLSLSVVLSQLAYHGVFLLAPGAAAVSSTSPAPHRHGVAEVLIVVSGGAAGSAHDHLASSGAGMWFAHLAAAIVTIIAIRRGERTLLSLLRLGQVIARGLVVRILSLPGLVVDALLPARRRPAAASVVLPKRLGVVLSSLRHRGPPLLVLPV